MMVLQNLFQEHHRHFTRTTDQVSTNSAKDCVNNDVTEQEHPRHYTSTTDQLSTNTAKYCVNDDVTELIARAS